MKIVADDKIPFLRGVLESQAKIVYLPGDQISAKDLHDADGLIVRTRTKCNANLLNGSKVQFIATATIGFDHIDTHYCAENGIIWRNAPGCNSGSVMQYIVAALLQIANYKKYQLSDKTLGVVGVGNVGSKVVAAAQALGIKVLQNDPPRERKEGSGDFVPLSEVLTQSDIITFHVPLNQGGDDNTRHLLNYKKMTSLKKGAIIINTSRGEIVDNHALKAAIIQEFVDEAVLDVFEKEPEIDQDLLCMLLLGTPHIAGYSADGKANGTAMSVQAMSRHFGLNLDNWYPEDVPEPANPVIEVKNDEPQKVLTDIISHTYTIVQDDDNLKTNPRQFEQLRGNYPLRREFPAYTVVNNKLAPALLKTIKNLGFKVQQ